MFLLNTVLRRLLLGTTPLLFCLPFSAQTSFAALDSTVSASLALPDSPGAARFSSSADGLQQGDVPQAAPVPLSVAPQTAKKFATTIRPGETATKLTVADKFEMGVRRPATLGSFAAAATSAGWAHLNDNRPHYGTDSAGFGERLGASNLKSASQSIFNFGLYASLFRQDPRYYVMGPQQPLKKRAIYAASRVFITRKDSGGNAPNWSLFSAVASSSALTNAYYPSRDRAIDRTFLNVLSTLATRMATQQFREFGGDIKQHLHLKH